MDDWSQYPSTVVLESMDCVEAITNFLAAKKTQTEALDLRTLILDDDRR